MLRAMTGRLPRHLLRSLTLIACTLTTGAAQGAESACRLEPLGSGMVVSVVDGRSFLLDDGREVRLAGLQIPALARPGDKDDIAGRAAKAAHAQCAPARMAKSRSWKYLFTSSMAA